MTTLSNTQKEQMANNRLENFVKNYAIFIDSCIFLHSNYELFMSNAKPHLRKYNAQMIVPYSVIGELQDVAKKKPCLKKRVDKALADIAGYNKNGLIRVIGSKEDDEVADQVFLTKFTEYRMKRNLLLITNDVNLAANIEGLGVCSSVRNIKQVKARRITRYGYLQCLVQTQSESQSSACRTAPATKVFAMGQRVDTTANQQLQVSCTVKEGSILTARNGERSWQVQLASHMADGGEGDIYATAGHYVAKIYMPAAVTRMKHNKLELLLNHRLSYGGICFPKAMLYNEYNEFVGYLMPRAEGHELQHLLNNRAYLQQHFPHWTKKDLIQLCLTLLKQFKFLHEHNIVVGDINLRNILVESPYKVYFVDTDSYQVENYPCPVGTVHFTAPEIQGCHYPDFLRTKGHEHFAVATLMFMIMMMGKSPYAKQGGGDIAENIRCGDFSYPMGEASNRMAPMGDWRYLWSHLSLPIKKAFYDSFHRDGAHRAEHERLSDDEWIKLFSNYLHGLEHGMLDRDAMSGELFPTRLKRSDLVKQKVCKRCGAKVPEYELRGGICHDCSQRYGGDTATNASYTPAQPPSYTPPQQQPGGFEKIFKKISDFFS